MIFSKVKISLVFFSIRPTPRPLSVEFANQSIKISIGELGVRWKSIFSRFSQVTFVLRFCHLCEGIWEVKERFIKFEDCEKKKGHDIAIRVLKDIGVSIDNCRAQAYDNGSNTSVRYRGAQAKIKERNQYAEFLPCSTHSLNLAGVHAVESCVEMKNYFGNVQKLYNFFAASPQRWKILKDVSNISLHSMSTTRWSARIEAVKPLYKKFDEIVICLRDIKRDCDLPSHLNADVDALIKWLQSFEFVLLTVIWMKVLKMVNDVSVMLQGTQITIDREMELIDTLLEDLQKIRTSWPDILSEAKDKARQFNIEDSFPMKRQRKRTRFHISYSIVLTLKREFMTKHKTLTKFNNICIIFFTI